MNKKKIRIFIGLVVVAVLFFAIAPKLYLFNSADGVVNGRILTLHSPIEEIDVLEKTIIGAKNIDYPNFKVWVLDDTKRQWLKEHCAEKGVGVLNPF